jgi:PKD repeat protein
MLFLVLSMILILINAARGYSRILSVDMQIPGKVEINESVSVEANITTGNNVVEYTHNVSVVLLLPPNVSLTPGSNPLFIGEMGPGPAMARCKWTVEFEEPGQYVLTVNASCIDTQHIARWMDASATADVYGPPHVEFEYTPVPAYVSNDITFNATKSYGQGPNSQPATYTWDFGDGTFTTTFIPIVGHQYTVVGNYTVSLNITDDSPFALSAANATMIAISLYGDLNADGRVNIVDVTIVAQAYGSTIGTPNWNPAADLNSDGTINILDLALVAREYGKTE